MCTLHEYVCTFMIIPCIIVLRLRNVLDKNCRENKNILFIFSNFLKILPPMRLMWENMVEVGWSQMTVQYGACTLHAG